MGGPALCGPEERLWTCFDVFLVSLSIVDVVLGFIAAGGGDNAVRLASSGKMLKIVRIARIMRILRMLRFMAELRVMANMIINSMMSLFWLFTLLAAMIYMFAIVLTQGATDYLRT